MKEMDAKEVVSELEHKGIIPQGEQKDITKTSAQKQQNEILFECLKKTCTKDAFIRFCDILIKVKGNPNMNALGSDLKRRLTTRQCKCAYNCAFLCTCMGDCHDQFNYQLVHDFA